MTSRGGTMGGSTLRPPRNLVRPRAVHLGHKIHGSRAQPRAKEAWRIGIAYSRNFYLAGSLESKDHYDDPTATRAAFSTALGTSP